MSGGCEIEVEGEQSAVAADGKTEDISEGLFQRFVVQTGCRRECGRPAADKGHKMQGVLRDASLPVDCGVFVPGVEGTADETGNEVKCRYQNGDAIAAGEYAEEKEEGEADSEGDAPAGSV